MKGDQGTRYNYAVIFLVALGSFTYGFNASIMGTVFGLTSFYSYFRLETTGTGAAYANSIIGATQGLFSAGGIVGCCIVAWLANAVGRKLSVQIICTICIISAVIQCASVHIAMLLIGRFLNGVGSGMINCIVPLYQSEVSPAHLRGRLVGSHGFLLVVGYAVAGWTGLGCYFENNPAIQWRLCLALQVVGPLFLLIGTLQLPESPRWLLSRGKGDEALTILSRLHHSTIDNDDTLARNEFAQIERQLALDAEMPQSILQVMKIPSYRKRLLLGLLIQCAAQSTGVLVINNYQVLLYNGLGLTGWLPLLLYAIYASWAAVLNWAGALIVDRAGRIKMLSIGITGCALMVACETAMVAVYGGTTNRIGNGFGVFFLFCFVTFYGSCVDAISYIYCAEIFPTSLRSQGVALSVTGLFAMNLVYTQTAPITFANVGWRFYLLFIIVPLVCVPVILKVCPETKGLTLEEVGALFGDKVAPGLNESKVDHDETVMDNRASLEKHKL
ncbi:general substrate transporter [Elsinoe ampelina]|uniref:General substrate transporter n=1 Tax=Elsinoe ampelina TaxID=302913 RepID=A0A6A6GKU7_9PEZI|nr:general substrate transporter [Elsinoe ampelina]